MSQARHVDLDRGIVEEAEFFDGENGRIFGIRYEPLSADPRAGVVMCDPILSQFRAHYRTGVLTARNMAAQGLAIQRFHYRGMGNSDGDVSDIDLDSMTDDAIRASARLAKRLDRPIAFLGVNLGSYAAAGASSNGSPLILDSPPPTGHQYFRNAVRAYAVYQMKLGVTDPLTMERLSEDLDRPGADVTLLGCRLSRRLFDSLSATSIVDRVGEGVRPILFFGLGSEGALRPEGEKLRAELTNRGFEVEVEVKPKVDPFWYAENSAPEDQPGPRRVAERVVGWLKDRADRGLLSNA